MKIVINGCFGGFGLSNKAKKLYCDHTGVDKVYDWKISRTDPILISIVEELGDEANDDCASLHVVEIPDNSYYDILDYDGAETLYYSASPIEKI